MRWESAVGLNVNHIEKSGFRQDKNESIESPLSNKQLIAFFPSANNSHDRLPVKHTLKQDSK